MMGPHIRCHLHSLRNLLCGVKTNPNVPKPIAGNFSSPAICFARRGALKLSALTNSSSKQAASLPQLPDAILRTSPQLGQEGNDERSDQSGGSSCEKADQRTPLFTRSKSSMSHTKFSDHEACPAEAPGAPAVGAPFTPIFNSTKSADPKG